MDMVFSFVQLDDADYFIIGDFEDAIISAPYQLLKVMAVQRRWQNDHILVLATFSSAITHNHFTARKI